MDFPNLKGQYKGSVQAQSSGFNVDALKKNPFYALQSRGEQETSPDVVTGILKVFSTNVYSLLDSGATLSFVTTLVAKSLIPSHIFCMSLSSVHSGGRVGCC